MNKNFPLFSVIIPQKNRAEYIGHTLRTCMIQDYPCFEIIVSDDCSDDNSVEVIEELAKIDNRIKLFAHKEHLGMRDNFEFALNQVKPGYVLALGGDDGLVPGCIWEMYKILSKTKKDLLTWKPALFSYPRTGSVNNIFAVPRFRHDKIKLIKSEDFLNKIATTFDYLIDECPMIYMKGVVSTHLIEKVKSRTVDHSFYYCPTPDGFSGVVLAGEVDEYVYTSKPLSIGGDSPKSQGRIYLQSDKKSRIEAEQFFNDNIRRTMHSELASQQYSPLIQLMTADYLLTAKDLPGWPGRFKKISFESLIIKSIEAMARGQYDNEVLGREMRIVKEIAAQHGLLDVYEKHIRRQRKVSMIKPTYGFLITNSVRFNGTTIGIYNIFDAAIAVNFVHNSYQRVGIKSVWRLIKRSFKAYINSKDYQNLSFPAID